MLQKNINKVFLYFRVKNTIYFKKKVFLTNEWIEIVNPNLLNIQYELKNNIINVLVYLHKKKFQFTCILIKRYISVNNIPISNASQFHQPPQLNSWLAQ